MSGFSTRFVSGSEEFEVGPVNFLSHPGIGSAIARYCPLWAPLSALTVLFLGTHEQLPSGSPILGLLLPQFA
ncbi:unnamed protein product [Prunus armeniaca]